jgi:hypothetical protein
MTIESRNKRLGKSIREKGGKEIRIQREKGKKKLSSLSFLSRGVR